ncbi:MAG: class GN sortase [Pseudomonadota bacterium]
MSGLNVFRWSKRVALTICLLGVLMTLDSLWLIGKASLAQYLIAIAWDQPGEGRPWPWADTRPIARLSAMTPSGQVHSPPIYVLAGANGGSLPFGPGHMAGSAFPGSEGTVVLAGHRDTHFRFMEHVAIGDRLVLEPKNGSPASYQVRSTDIVDVSRIPNWSFANDADELHLITCYPFTDWSEDDGRQRYVIQATRDHEPD